MDPFSFLHANDANFSAPHPPPASLPINRVARYSPPPVPRELHSAVKQQPIPRLPSGVYFNSSNPGRVNLKRR